MFTIKKSLSNLQIVSVALRRLDSSAASGMQAYCASGARNSATLFDLSGVGRIAASGISALIHLAQTNINTGFFGANPKVQSELEKFGLHRALRLYENEEVARNSPWVKGKRLSGTKAVILAAGKGSRCAPLTRSIPKPMLPILGRPIIEHLLEHLGRFGLNDVLINPGYLGPKIIDHLKSGASFNQHIHYANEGYFADGQWRAQPLGSASTIACMHQQNAAFFDDFFVFCGDALVDLDLAAMMDHHRKSGAVVTIATQTVDPNDVEKFGIIDCNQQGRINAFQEKPAKDNALSTLANTGIYIFNPAVLSHIPNMDLCDIGTHLLPKLLAEGVHLQVFNQPFTWVDVGCGKDFFQANMHALCGRIPFVRHFAKLGQDGTLLSEKSTVSGKADVAGPVFLGENAHIESGATIRGPVFLGPNTVAKNGSYIKNSMLWENTTAAKGAIVDGLIADGHWAFAHEYANKAAQNIVALDNIHPNSDREIQRHLTAALHLQVAS